MKLLDFDELLELHQNDPEALEKYRKDIIEELIESSPKEIQQRLRAIIWNIETRMRNMHDPMQRLNYAFSFMWDSLLRLHKEYQQL